MATKLANKEITEEERKKYKKQIFPLIKARSNKRKRKTQKFNNQPILLCPIRMTCKWQAREAPLCKTHESNLIGC
jgi:hypothetical protein